MTINNNTGLSKSCNWNEEDVKFLPRINWRASLVPAAAVIPAPIAYIKVVAVKKLVVGFLMGTTGPPPLVVCTSVLLVITCGERVLAFICRWRDLHRLL